MCVAATVDVLKNCPGGRAPAWAVVSALCECRIVMCVRVGCRQETSVGVLACCWVSGAARVLFPCGLAVCGCDFPGVSGGLWLCGVGVVCENCIVDASIFIFCVCLFFVCVFCVGRTVDALAC